MKRTYKLVIILLVTFELLSSCATILSGRKQDVRITSIPKGANVLVNGKDLNLTTPCVVKLKRKVKPGAFNNRNEYRFIFQKEGFADFEVIDHRRINPTIYWNVATWLFVVVTLPVDFITGAGYKYSDNIFSELQPLQMVNNQNINTSNVTDKRKDKLPPQITITNPDLDRGFKQIVKDDILTVSGKATDESGIDEVVINTISATVLVDGSFQADIPLHFGNNKISVSATDNNMNVASETFYIERNNQSVQQEITENLTDSGSYHALIIGIQDYSDPRFNDLDHPLRDAARIYQTLTKYYQFDSSHVILLENPTRELITEKLEYFYKNLSDKDNLLIFYAGHGFWDQKFKQGYWLPSDARENNRGTWLSNSTLRDYIRAIPCKHSLLITDACFAGAIFKTRDAFPDASKAINQMYNLPSRKAITSGALNTVPDESVFLEYLLKRLEENKEKYLSSEQLFASFKIAVINNSPDEQVPQYGEVKETGDEGGDFIFIKKQQP